MFDTNVTIVGNVLTAPEWRRTTQTGTLVANFKVASTARRLDRESGRWVDGNSLRVRVNCWRRLAEGVASSVMVGDPIIVVGRMYTRDWTDEAGNHRTMYELEAVAVGHDLSRGRGRFVRNRPTASTSALEDAEAESRVNGEATEPVSIDEVPVRPDHHPFDEDDDLGGDVRYGGDRGLPVPPDPGLGTSDPELAASLRHDLDAGDKDEDEDGGYLGVDLPAGQASGTGESRGDVRPQRDETDAAGPEDSVGGDGQDADEIGDEIERVDGRSADGRGRRKRVAVPA
ncbi:single-stranded DNA-binding protein [Micromonospora sp. HM5-17]|jgi:single-strand DNA-binding protein|uniref:single-stranded DNA-binding protein n=1 Tax=Micromonospora sp. HM5-17 TaxID=2487710 RepID=UPI000F47795B|nr:single-stranded DNA-binding protein [Micromonospora sp. HM5-17]ROT32454.1 single-stranded DNA-binding protein [Micromonospora sp. HM5-17]